jgi:antitoxin FitA
MVAISVRDLDEDVVLRLKVRAAEHGRSMEAEVRVILAEALAPDSGDEPNFLLALRAEVLEIGGVDLDIPPRRDMPRAPDFTKRR